MINSLLKFKFNCEKIVLVTSCEKNKNWKIPQNCLTHLTRLNLLQFIHFSSLLLWDPLTCGIGRRLLDLKSSKHEKQQNSAVDFQSYRLN